MQIIRTLKQLNDYRMLVVPFWSLKLECILVFVFAFVCLSCILFCRDAQRCNVVVHYL